VKGTAISVVDCAHCVVWATDRRGGRITEFIVDGVRHYGPEIWLQARVSRYYGSPIEMFLAACRDWAVSCAVATAALCVRPGRRLDVVLARRPAAATPVRRRETAQPVASQSSQKATRRRRTRRR
jgi:hypothetical protein